MKKNIFYLLFLVLIVLASPASLARNSKAENKTITAYAALLSAHVTLGEKNGIRSVLVDYNAWRKDPNHYKALEDLQHQAIKNAKGEYKKALWINAYNLLTIDVIIKTGENESIKNQGGFLKSVWKKHRWNIQGISYSLDDIEHRILRPMGDPRVHMAINCAALSCPDLRNKPYTEKNINNELHEQTVLFVSNPHKGIRIDKADRSSMRISKIFKWFAADFGTKKEIEQFIYRHSKNSERPKIKGYIFYSWQLNAL